MEKTKKRNWCMLLYPEDQTHVNAMETLEKGGYKYAAILHDSDTYEDGEHKGEVKKEHWHVVIKFPQARYNTAIAKELGIADNYLEPCANLDKALLYLVHANAEEKHQYSPESVFGSLAPQLSKLLQDDDEGMRVLEIVKQVDACPGRASYRDLLVWACKNGLYGEFRRLGAGVTALISEHNDDVYRESNPQYGERCPSDRVNAFMEFTGDKNIQPL